MTAAATFDAPGPRLSLEIACGGRETGSGAPLPLAPTRRLERVAVDPGPMPVRWSRGQFAGRYVHDTGGYVLATDDGRAMAMLDLGGTLEDVEAVIRDVADLLTWLRRGGR